MKLALINKIKLYGFKKSLGYGLSEGRYFLQQKLKGSFSQLGEDLVIDKLLGHKKQGFYVDIGAYDPHRFSNTKRFYLRGWRGINIDPDPINYEKFIKERPRDINLNVGIAEKPSLMPFYRMFPGTLSTFSLKEAEEYQKKGYKLIGELKITVNTLASVLSKYRKSGEIDFISIDTEGFDLIVLKSNNWNKFRPRIVCIETSCKISENNDDKASFLNKVDYEIVADNGLNSIFVDTKSDK